MNPINFSENNYKNLDSLIKSFIIDKDNEIIPLKSKNIISFLKPLI